MTRQAKGFTLVELLVVVAIIALLVSILLPALGQAKELVKQSICASNLKNIGTGIKMYQAANKDSPPWIDTFSGTRYPKDTGTNAGSESQPGLVSPTALMFLLVRSGQNVDMFRCPSDGKAVKMDSVKFTGADGKSYYYWDFCDTKSPDPGGEDCKRVSYSYQAPIGSDSSGGSFPYRCGFTDNSGGAMAVMADKTPRYDGKEPRTDWTVPLTDEERRDGMSQNHNAGDFINVLFADAHVKGSKRADVGISNDNIYSGSYGEPTEQGAGFGSMYEHRSEDDSYLIGPIDYGR